MLARAAEGGPEGTDRGGSLSVRVADHIVQLYGIPSLLIDIDRERDFCSEGDSCVHRVLGWISEEGFEEFFSRFDFEQKSARAFRERYIVGALTSLGKILTAGRKMYG